MFSRITIRLLSFACLTAALAGCSKDEAKPASQTEPPKAAAPAAALVKSNKTLHEKILGTWKFDAASNPTLAKDPATAAAFQKLVITVIGDAITDPEGKKDTYKVVKEDANQLTVKVGAKEETYAFKDDDTIAVKDPEMGDIVFKRGN